MNYLKFVHKSEFSFIFLRQDKEDESEKFSDPETRYFPGPRAKRQINRHEEREKCWELLPTSVPEILDWINRKNGRSWDTLRKWGRRFEWWMVRRPWYKVRIYCSTRIKLMSQKWVVKCEANRGDGAGKKYVFLERNQDETKSGARELSFVILRQISYHGSIPTPIRA